MGRKVLLAVACLLTTHLFAQRVDPVFLAHAVDEKQYPPSLRLAERSTSEPMVTLSAVDTQAEDLAAIHLWNSRGGTPARNGFTRRISEPMAVRIRPGAAIKSARGTAVWSGSVRVKGAYRFRLHLENVHIPAGSVFWVYGKGETPIAFDSRLIDESGSLYTPSVGGDTAYLELEVPASRDASFDIEDLLELVGAPTNASSRSVSVAPSDAPTCLVDATCVGSSTLDVIDAYRRAVAHLQYVKNGSGYVCTGGLLNDTDTVTSIPYLLTANHCFSDQTSATSVEAFWDYKTSTCTGSFPSLSTIPRTNGSQLLATSSVNDFTFVRMNSVPAGRALLGWNAATSVVSSGTRLHRISHPYPAAFTQPGPQSYSSTFVDTVVGTCSTAPRGNYIYSTGGQGGVYGGSSGSPVIIAGGFVVGQLKGSCGPNDPSAGCDQSNSTMDGAFSVTYPSISAYLSAAPTGPCVPSATTACMLNNRFRATVRYRAGFDNQPADTDALLKAVSGFSSPTYETAFFYFNSPNNIEMMAKLLDQGNTDDQNRRTIAVLFGSATPLRLELILTDTQNGAVRRYQSDFGTMKGATEFTAFVK